MGAATEWGEEVMSGVFMMRRSQASYQAQLSRLAQAHGHTVEFNFTKIYEDIESAKELIRRLETSNELLRQHLAEEAREDAASSSGGESMTLAGRGVDQEVEDAIAENEVILRQKRAELRELLSLVSMHKCGHEHGDQCPVHETELAEDRSSCDSSSSSSSDDEEDETPFEEGGNEGGVTSLAQMSAHAQPTRFTL